MKSQSVSRSLIAATVQPIDTLAGRRNWGHKQNTRLNSVGTTLASNTIDSMDVDNAVAAQNYRSHFLFSTSNILWHSNAIISAKNSQF